MDQATSLRNLVRGHEVRKNVATVITVTSGKGGVGKSNMSVNLAIQLQNLGKRVIILDADFGLANVEVMFGIRPKYSLADLMFKNKGLREIICSGPRGIGVISGGSGIQEMANLTKYQIGNLTSKLYELDDLADVIIIDTGAGISDAVLEFVTHSTQVVLVATPEPTSITDAYALLKSVNKREDFDKAKSIQMITNRVGSTKEGKELFGKLEVVVKRFLDVSIEFLGAVPQDANVSKAVMRQVPFSIAYPNTQATAAVYDIANKLLGNSVHVQKDKKGIAYLFSKLMHK
ncbi:MinD/ParA family protein [[Clostridium] polysaccharolyticum]|jgi:flagellar biosynthesis protein FlhG|uniref:Flagellar biosynthesis protein FlhG n=1 Tax=[Clostridium] polysaccharolyticum TaxID=29364 RepID=A0A1H9Y2Z2_9FIRM|nr:MinD/ParA family protein [[Clostridium] polysaccharolyticum]SES63089.1 flagellar biosynthesis protein FlhG [[Clostridium] polysaccharolyticum]